MFLDRFFNYLQFEKRCSPHTLLSYKNDIQQFSVFLNHTFETTLKDAEYPMMRSWVMSLVEKDITAISIARKLSALKSFYKFLNKEGIIEKNPTIYLKAPKTSKKLPVFLEENKLNVLLDSEHIFEDSFKGLRDKLVIELLFGCGLRLSELVNLKIGDIYLQENLIKVLGKRNKERLIPVNKSLNGAILAYLNERNMQTTDHQFLVVTDNYQKLYPKFIYRLVHKYVSLISTQDKRSPHVLRHTFATSLLNNGADINAIKELLGHANLSATQIYTHNTLERIKTIYKQAHPKA